MRRLFKTVAIDRIEEIYDPAEYLVQHPLFERFGLGDVSVAAACQRKVIVLTSDLSLQLALTRLGLDAINFNHVRVLGWRH